MIVLNINPIAFSIGKIDIKWYGLAYVAGFLICQYINQKIIRSNFVCVEKDKFLNFFKNFDSVLLLSILVGGRLGYFLFYLRNYSYNIVDILKIYEGGMSFYGAIIAVIVSTIYYSFIKKVPYLTILDLIAIVSPIGIFLGRLANFINQELYGKVIHNTKLPWATIFPKVDFLPRHPTQLYEAILEGIVLFVLMIICCFYFKALRKKGLITGIFTIFYSIFRIISEFFREDIYGPVICLGSQFSIGHILSLIAIIFCILCYAYKLFLYKFFNSTHIGPISK
jgi:phosphatidylglycerol:prolipoprotein diacylglycerol transferase